MIIKVGNVFSISTSKDLAYFQFVMQNKSMGSLIRVLPGTYRAEPESWDVLVGQTTNF